MTQTRFGHLDSMRFVAAALVLFQHIFEKRPGFVHDVIIPVYPGLAGVAIFFCVSGYVIPLSVRGKLDLRSFVIRRFFRIYPLYLAALLLLVVLGAPGLLPKWGDMTAAPLSQWIANLLLVQDFVGATAFLGVSWTVAVEIIWYGLFAAALLCLGKRAGDVLDIVVPVSLLVLALASLALGFRIPLGRPTMIYAAVLGYQCYRYTSGEIGAWRMARSIGMFAFVALSTNIIAFGVYAHPNVSLTQMIYPWIVGTALFLGGVLSPTVREWRWFGAGLLPALGAMSYSTYLLHPLALDAARTYAPFAYQVPVMLLLIALLSVLGYRLVEKPGIELGRLVSRRVAGAALQMRAA